MSISSLLIRLVVFAAVLTGLAAIGRAAGSKWQPAPGSADGRRGRKGMNPLAIFALVLGGLVVMAVGSYAVLIGTWWMACRGGGSC